jgi:hypothetical protein
MIAVRCKRETEFTPEIYGIKLMQATEYIRSTVSEGSKEFSIWMG